MEVTADVSCEDLGEVDVKRGIFEGESFTTVVCLEYGTFIADT